MKNQIDPTFLRGKRIGSIITLTHPDAETAKKIIESELIDESGNSLLVDDCDVAAKMIEELEIVPAFIMEILGRVKAHLLYEERSTVTCQDIINSINSYKEQMDLSKLKVLDKSVEVRFADNLKEVLQIDKIQNQIKEIKEQI